MEDASPMKFVPHETAPRSEETPPLSGVCAGARFRFLQPHELFRYVRPACVHRQTELLKEFMTV